MADRQVWTWIDRRLILTSAVHDVGEGSVDESSFSHIVAAPAVRPIVDPVQDIGGAY
jgi:hypothetical protein